MCPVIKIGFLFINSYNLCVFMAILITVICAILIRTPKDYPIKPFPFGIAILTAYFIFQHFFGKLLHSLIYINVFNFSDIQLFYKVGFAYLVVVVAALAIFWLLYGKARNSTLIVLDATAGLSALEHSIEKLGCLLTGCCRGTFADVPWAIYLGREAGRHPTQAYEMIAVFSISLTMLIMYWRLRRYAGASLFLCVILYSLTRFINEFFRVGSKYITFGLTVSHFAMVAMFILGAAGMYYFVIKKASDKEGLSLCLLKSLVIFIAALTLTGGTVLSILSHIHAAH